MDQVTIFSVIQEPILKKSALPLKKQFIFLQYSPPTRIVSASKTHGIFSKC